MSQFFVYLWTFPTTAFGLCIAVLGALSGGHIQRADGIIEAYGGAVTFFLRHCTLLRGGASAMTLGHVVLARDAHLLAATRRHERVHVRQCERWGPLFIPAYLLASLFAWIRGRQPYRDNPFEREAFNAE